MSKAPREGSRKAEVYAVFHDKGLEAAIEKAVALGLKAGTVKSWAGGWAGSTKQAPSPDTRKGPRTPKEAVVKGTEHPHGAFSPHFRHGTHAAAQRDVLTIARRSGVDNRAYHVLEQDGKFAVAPVHYKPTAAPPTFKKGDTVHDLFIPNNRGVIIEAGPEVSVVRVKGKPDQAVSNYYLYKFDDTTTTRPRELPTKAKKPKAAKAPEPAKKPAPAKKQAPAKKAAKKGARK